MTLIVVWVDFIIGCVCIVVICGGLHVCSASSSVLLQKLGQGGYGDAWCSGDWCGCPFVLLCILTSCWVRSALAWESINVFIGLVGADPFTFTIRATLWAPVPDATFKVMSLADVSRGAVKPSWFGAAASGRFRSFLFVGTV